MKLKERTVAGVSLSVTLNHELVRDVTRVFGSRAGEGSHGDAISQIQVSEYGVRSALGLSLAMFVSLGAPTQ